MYRGKQCGLGSTGGRAVPLQGGDRLWQGVMILVVGILVTRVMGRRRRLPLGQDRIDFDHGQGFGQLK